jgi:hypothetical protein
MMMYNIYLPVSVVRVPLFFSEFSLCELTKNQFVVSVSFESLSFFCTINKCYV